MNGAERGGFTPEVRQNSFQLNEVEKNYIASLSAEGVDRTPVNPEKFVNVVHYTPEEIAADLRAVEDLKQKFDDEDSGSQSEFSKLAHATEYFIAEKIELSNWFGDDVLMIAASEYDDIFNGFDAFVEFQDESRLGLALDFTFSQAKTEKKFSRIKKEIKHDELPRAKYFDSESYIGPLESVARLVIDLDREVIDELMRKQMLVKYYKNKGNREIALKYRKEIDNHPLQIDLLEQMLLQLEAFRQYAVSLGREKFVKLYEDVEKSLRAIYEEKKSLREDELYIKQLKEGAPKGADQVRNLLRDFQE